MIAYLVKFYKVDSYSEHLSGILKDFIFFYPTVMQKSFPPYSYVISNCFFFFFLVYIIYQL